MVRLIYTFSSGLSTSASINVNVTVTHSYTNGTDRYGALYLSVNKGDYSIIDISFTVPDASLFTGFSTHNSYDFLYAAVGGSSGVYHTFAKNYSVTKLSGNTANVSVSGNGNFGIDISLDGKYGPGEYSGSYKAVVSSTQNSNSANARYADNKTITKSISGSIKTLQPL